MERNYENGKVYCTRNNIDDDIYIGSTTQPLSKRMVKHRNNLNNVRFEKIQLYAKMRELGVENFYIELLEECACETIEQLRKREGELIREFGTLNTRMECRTVKEYQQDNKDHIKERKHNYNIKNRERISEQKKIYYEDKKDAISQRKAQTIECVCGSVIKRGDKAKHVKTKKHEEYINNQN